MAEHCVVLWVEGDNNPEEVDWVKICADNGFAATGERIRSFPWRDVYHEVIWWITRPMNIEEWSKMDDLESEALSSVVGDHFMGTAGPIPLLEEDE